MIIPPPLRVKPSSPDWIAWRVRIGGESFGETHENEKCASVFILDEIDIYLKSLAANGFNTVMLALNFPLKGMKKTMKNG